MTEFERKVLVLENLFNYWKSNCDVEIVPLQETAVLAIVYLVSHCNCTIQLYGGIMQLMQVVDHVIQDDEGGAEEELPKTQDVQQQDGGVSTEAQDDVLELQDREETHFSTPTQDISKNVATIRQ